MQASRMGMPNVSAPQQEDPPDRPKPEAQARGERTNAERRPEPKRETG